MPFFRSMCLSVWGVSLALAFAPVHAGEILAAPQMPPARSASASIDRIIVSYRTDATERTVSTAALQHVQAAIAAIGLDGAQTSHRAAPLAASYQRTLATGAHLIKLSRNLSPGEQDALVQRLMSDPAVAYAEPDLRLQPVRDVAVPTAIKATEPDDPDYAKYQWHLRGAPGGASVSDAWDLADGEGVVVAVLDTGITQHPDIDLSLADAGYDFITSAFLSGRDADGRVPGGWDLGDWTTTEPWLSACEVDGKGRNSTWHGTHVAGTVAELTGNGTGMAGVAPRAKVLPVRVLGHCGGSSSDIAEAIVWASGGHVEGVPDNMHPAQVINLSLGGQGSCASQSVTAQAIAEANKRGTTVVVAAGNSNSDVANFTPANCPGVIAVASNGITGQRARYYSNYGSLITLSAPGGGIFKDDAASGDIANPEGFVWSAINLGATVPEQPGYIGNAGTSMAAPHVSGAVALVHGALKDAGEAMPTPDAMRQILVQSARPFPVAVDRPIGAGIIDANAAVKLALAGGPAPDPVTELSRGVVLGNQSAPAGGSRLYSIKVPAGALDLNIRTMAGVGDVMLFVKAGAVPQDGVEADFVSAKAGNSEAVIVSEPSADTYYLRVKSDRPFAGLSVLATYRL
ncbi:S8 family serine peptidase [Dyella sp. BiH032]|uniref:S8 family serine peptidase n=1 Tax=Dyella sp. BiH032 TaxID=3075430 RepID=UPI002892A783|nr:S8 family serine peptidase [Dyella sp. BiH032]WNL44481.1 S8 family serine peptidase [Dyella sp. BiH032]